MMSIYVSRNQAIKTPIMIQMSQERVMKKALLNSRATESFIHPSSVATTRLEVGLIAVVGRFHNRLSRLNRGNRSAPVVATRLESQLRVDQSWIPLPSQLPRRCPQLHNIPVVAYFYPEIEIHLHGLVLRCNDNGRPTPFAVRLSQTSPQPWIRLARVPGTAYASR